MISIIIVTYNRFEYFSRCIESIIATTKNTDKELIIWDNGSKDGTVELIEKYANDYSFVRPVLNNVNIGVNAKSKSFELARGDYIVCFDDDVIELPEGWTEKMVKAFLAESKLGYLALDVVQN